MPGRLTSISTRSGRSVAASSTASSPDDGSADDLEPGSFLHDGGHGAQILLLVVDQQHSRLRHVGLTSTTSLAADERPRDGVSRTDVRG